MHHTRTSYEASYEQTAEQSRLVTFSLYIMLDSNGYLRLLLTSLLIAISWIGQKCNGDSRLWAVYQHSIDCQPLAVVHSCTQQSDRGSKSAEF